MIGSRVSSRPPIDDPRPYYKAMTQALDTEIGRLLVSLPPHTRDRTPVIFVGDNGTPGEVMAGGDDGRGKTSLYEGGVNIPFIVAGNRVTAASHWSRAAI